MVDLATAVLVADISGWQQADAAPLAGDGFRGVIIKVAEGLSGSNNVRWQQAESARRAGMALIGKYNFSLDRNDGAAECDAAVAQLGDFPFHRVVMDAEASTFGPLPDYGQVVAFGRRAREWNPNIKPLLYASESPMAGVYGTAEVAELFDLWYAQYDSYAPKTWPSHGPHNAFPGGGNVIGWQFTSTFPSSIGAIDASVFDPAALEGADVGLSRDEVRAEIDDHLFTEHDEFGGYSVFTAKLEEHVAKPTGFGLTRVGLWVLSDMKKFASAFKQALGL